MQGGNSVNNKSYDEYLKTPQWQEKRSQRLKIDNYTCQMCERKTGLQVHHLNYDRIGKEDIYRDLITLCTDCHEKVEAGKSINSYKQIIRDYEYKLRELMAEKFAKENEKNDISGGGNLDLCKNEIIRPLLVEFQKQNGLSDIGENVKQVNDYFRDRRYEVMRKIYTENPQISSWQMHQKTGFKLQMADKFLKKLRSQTEVAE